MDKITYLSKRRAADAILRLEREALRQAKLERQRIVTGVCLMLVVVSLVILAVAVLT